MQEDIKLISTNSSNLTTHHRKNLIVNLKISKIVPYSTPKLQKSVFILFRAFVIGINKHFDNIDHQMEVNQATLIKKNYNYNFRLTD